MSYLRHGAIGMKGTGLDVSPKGCIPERLPDGVKVRGAFQLTNGVSDARAG